jgi:tetratricopeptide (TPR) repeat protein
MRVKPASDMDMPKSTFVHVLLILSLGLLVYSNTLKVPIVFDDREYILENPLITDLGHVLDLERAAGLDLHGNVRMSLQTRQVGYLSFALNHRLNGLRVAGYHMVNIAVHLINALLLYALVALTLRTPFLEGSRLRGHGGLVALFTALLFLSHPLQTQAVTYISQRFTSLAAMFCLICLVLYVCSRLAAGGSAKGAGFYLLSLLSAMAAMRTKEISFTLPLMVALYEFMFFEGNFKKRSLYLLPLLLTMLIVPLSIPEFGALFGESFRRATGTQEEITRSVYLLTGLRVVVTYIRLLFLPVNQCIDYDYPLNGSFLEPPVALSFFSLALLFGLGVCLYYRSRANAGLRLVSFGVLWFYVTLSVESSLVPLDDVIFEHRAYLPSVGFTAALVAFVYAAWGKRRRKAIGVFFAVVALLFSGAAYARNGVWQSGVSIWEDVVAKAPGKARGYNNLGLKYREAGRRKEAIASLMTAAGLKPDYPDAHKNLGLMYLEEGVTEKAIRHYGLALALYPGYLDAHYNLGIIFNKRGEVEKAIKHYKAALAIDPGFMDAHNNLGVAYMGKGDLGEAIRHYRAAIEIRPDYYVAHSNLGNALMASDRPDEAIGHYEEALRLNPGYAMAYYRLGRAFMRTGRYEAASRSFRSYLRHEPEDVDAIYGLAVVSRLLGLAEEAIGYFRLAIRLDPGYRKAYYGLGSLYGAMGNAVEAEEYLRKAGELK